LSDKLIVDIGCGQRHGLALTSDGKVYAWGKNWEEYDSNESDSEDSDWNEIYLQNVSQFDKNTTYFDVRQVKHKLEKKKVVHIACGPSFNIVVTDKNKLYGWGNNMGRQISNDELYYYKYPRKIITLSDKIIKAVCGDEHTLALTSKGEMYAWGSNSYGELGVNSNQEPSGPIVVNIPEMGKVLDIVAYRSSSVAVGCDRIIYVWGHFYHDFWITTPFATKFSNIHDAFAHSMWGSMHNSSIVFTNTFKYIEDVLNILESLKAIFDDQLSNDLTILVEGQPIYVHKAILKIRCQYFK
ncbi:RCC1 and BTB domain-containing protein 2, partial [Camponotus floridanus]